MIMEFCRICLSADAKMYTMDEHNLRGSYEILTNYKLAEDGTTRWLCWECTFRLLAFTRFRLKALQSQALLHQLSYAQHTQADSLPPELDPQLWPSDKMDEPMCNQHNY